MSGLSEVPSSSDSSPPVQNNGSNLETVPTATDEIYDGHLPPNTPLGASTTSFVLGCVFSVGSWLVLSKSHLLDGLWNLSPQDITFNNPTTQVSFFLAAWAFFHWAEFAVTAGWNREKLSTSSFLLDNGREYHIAHIVALTEFAVTAYFFPGAKQWSYVTPVGIFIVLVGQILRSAAMIHASTNFSHQVAYQHRDGHRLVTGGIYSWFRHPSYAGFFYWGIGTQIALQNPISFFGYFIVMLRFFYRRIYWEEKALVRFFGAEYEAYKATVPTRIPLIR